jgi:LAO/AO transport system kinase
MSRRSVPVPELFLAAGGGDRGALARLLSLVERGGDEAREVSRFSYRRSGHRLHGRASPARRVRARARSRRPPSAPASQGEEVAVLAIDPSSPFTGGAILGDRVRMQDHATDPGVFIRSMATRGHLGGLSLATPEAVRLLDAIGRHWILVETVGVGQVEVEIAGKADTTVVVVNPGWGDSVQANKAGLMEIADVFVINKADRKGVEETRRDLEQMLELSDLPHEAWRPPIIPVVATEKRGVARAVGHRAGAPGVHRGQRRTGPPPRVPPARGAARDRRPAARAACPRARHRRAVGRPAVRRVPSHARPVGCRRRDAGHHRRLSVLTAPEH